MDDAIKSLTQVETKEDALTEDARTVRSLLKYTEGIDALRAHTKKEFNAENLRYGAHTDANYNPITHPNLTRTEP